MYNWGLFGLGVFSLVLGVTVSLFVHYGIIKFKENRRFNYWFHHYWFYTRTRPIQHIPIEESRESWRYYYQGISICLVVLGVASMVFSFLG